VYDNVTAEANEKLVKDLFCLDKASLIAPIKNLN
jgi:hypothetical protein